jgi:RimJ/RimL family protein N-acetyltransferase
MWESRLTLASFEATPFVGALERAAASGVVIRTLADLPEGEATQRRLYEAVVALLGDVPFHEPLNIWPFEVWQRRFWPHPSRRPQSFFLALDGDAIVGMSELRKVAQAEWLGTGLTGVKRAYRRKGIALALKLSAAQHAKEAGFAVISTQNHTTNRAMLSINEALGFVKEPAWVKLEKDLSS